MSVIINGIDKPPSCEWVDSNHNRHRCPLLIDDDCALQECDEAWTWQDQYAGCPLSDIVYKPNDYCSYGEKL